MMLVVFEIKGVRLVVRENSEGNGFVLKADYVNEDGDNDEITIGAVRVSETNGTLQLFSDEEE